MFTSVPCVGTAMVGATFLQRRPAPDTIGSGLAIWDGATTNTIASIADNDRKSIAETEMFKLSTPANKQEYLFNNDKKVKLGNTEVEVMLLRRDGRSGSWERGFKFTSITYGLLKRTGKADKNGWARSEFSADHGATWWPTTKEALKSKGKVIVERSGHKEFAFDSIQRINRDYDPNYRWKP